MKLLMYSLEYSFRGFLELNFDKKSQTSNDYITECISQAKAAA